MKRQKSVQPPLGIARPTAHPTSWRGPSEVYAVRMRRLAAERRAHEQQRYEEERIAAVLTSPIFWKGIVKRMTPMHTWVKVEGRWRSRTLT